MNKNQLLCWLVFVPALTFAQQQWGYGIATVVNYDDRGKEHKQIFISDPIELSQAGCAIAPTGDEEGDQVEAYARYEVCMKTWFANKLQQSGKAKETDIQDLIGIVGLWPVHSLRSLLRNNTSIDYTHFLDEYSFTTKEKVEQQRLEFITAAKNLNSNAVLVH